MTYPPSSDQLTQQFTPPPPAQAPGQYQGQPQYAAPPPRSRPHVQIRSTFLTTEFWVLVVLSLGILIASAVSDDEGLGGFGAGQAWKYIAWLGVAYMISRGLTKLGGNRRDGGESGTRL